MNAGGIYQGYARNLVVNKIHSAQYYRDGNYDNTVMLYGGPNDGSKAWNLYYNLTSPGNGFPAFMGTMEIRMTPYAAVVTGSTWYIKLTDF